MYCVPWHISVPYGRKIEFLMLNSSLSVNGSFFVKFLCRTWQLKKKRNTLAHNKYMLPLGQNENHSIPPPMRQHQRRIRQDALTRTSLTRPSFAPVAAWTKACCWGWDRPAPPSSPRASNRKAAALSSSAIFSRSRRSSFSLALASRRFKRA